MIDAVREHRVRRSVHAHWQAELGRRRRRRRLLAAAATVALALLGAGVVRLSVGPSGGHLPSAVARLIAVAGPARVLARDAAGNAIPGRPPALDDPLAAGAGVVTEAGGRLALRLAGGQEIRIDESSAIRVSSATEVLLDRGAIYVDSPIDRPAVGTSPLVVRTPQGDVRDVGTQFEVRLEGEATRIRVREGAVLVRAGDADVQVPAGDDVLIDASARIDRRRVPADDVAWEWAISLARAPELVGRDVAELLDWVAREEGWRLAYADTAAAEGARTTVISGSLAGMGPAEALDAALPPSGLRHRIVDGALIVAVDPRPAATTGRSR